MSDLESPVVTINQDERKKTLRSFIQRNWTTFYFCFGLLVHIGCLVILQLTETNSEVPPKGIKLTLQQMAGYAMYINVLLMGLMVVLDSHLYIRRYLRGALLGRLEEDNDLLVSEKEAKAELKFISIFSRRYWRPVIGVLGRAGHLTLTGGSCILMLSVLCNVIALFIPSGTLPAEATQAMLFSLAIPGLLCLLAGLLMVLERMHSKYNYAHHRMGRVIGSSKLKCSEMNRIVDTVDLQPIDPDLPE